MDTVSPFGKLKIRILAPLTIFGFGLLSLFVAGGFVLRDRYHDLRDRIQEDSAIMHKVLHLTRLNERSKESLLQYRLTEDRQYLYKILDSNMERATVIEDLKESVAHRVDRGAYLKAVLDSQTVANNYHGSLVRDLEVSDPKKLRRLFNQWAYIEAMNVAKIEDFFDHISKSMMASERKLESFVELLFMAALLIFGAGGVVTYRLARYYQKTVLRPIEELRARLRAVTGGDLDARAQLPEVRDELWQMANDFNSMTAALRESQCELRGFVSAAAHDLRSPIATIQGFAEVIEEDVREGHVDSAIESATRVRAICERALGLMDHLLNRERVEGAISEFRRVSLDAVIGEALENLSSAIQAQQTIVEIDPLPFVEGDPSLLRALFQNLISNAIKYRRGEGDSFVRITSSTVSDTTGSWVEIRVIDNGRGFDNKMLGELFRPFTRLKGSHGTEGFGVGLSTCRKIALRHHGQIWADGKPGVGATFTVRLPAVIPAEITSAPLL